MKDRSKPDHWAQRAQREGYPARSVYKLEEINQRHRLLPRGGRVLDLGATPGSWGRYAARNAGPGLRLVGVDLNPSKDYPGKFVQASVFELDVEALRAALGGPADLVMSDMAPLTSGARLTDHLRQLELAEAALSLAQGLLRPGGAFIAKVFEGEDAPAFVQRARAHFETVKRMRPKAVRPESVEFFLVGLGFRAVEPA